MALTEKQKGGGDLGPGPTITVQHIDNDSTGTVIPTHDRRVANFHGARPVPKVLIGMFICVFTRTRFIQGQVGQIAAPKSGSLRDAHEKFVPRGMKNASELFQCAGASISERQGRAVGASRGANHLKNDSRIATDANSKEALRVEAPGELPQRSRGSTARQQTGKRQVSRRVHTSLRARMLNPPS